MKTAASSLVVALCLGLLCPIAHGQYYTLDSRYWDGEAGWQETESTGRIDLSTRAMVTGEDVTTFDNMGVRTFAAMRDDFREPDTISFDDDFVPPGGFAFSLKQIPYGRDMYRELGNDANRINADYLVSDLMVVTGRANSLLLLNTVNYEVRSFRIRDPALYLPIPTVAKKNYGKVSYETGERRTSIAVPLTCPAGFEYRMMDVTQSMTRENACRCQSFCNSDTATCIFSGSGMYAIAVVPEWLCEVDPGTPTPINEDDPLDEKAAIAAGLLLALLAICCCVICIYMCVRMGPPDDHWNHAPREPGAIPLKYSDPILVDEAAEVRTPDLPKAPPRLIPDGNPYPTNPQAYIIPDLNVPDSGGVFGPSPALLPQAPATPAAKKDPAPNNNVTPKPEPAAIPPNPGPPKPNPVPVVKPDPAPPAPPAPKQDPAPAPKTDPEVPPPKQKDPEPAPPAPKPADGGGSSSKHKPDIPD